MILFKFKEECEPSRPPGCNNRWRWTLQIGKYFIGFIQEGTGISSKWMNVRHAIVSVNTNFLFGSHHTYYDGPNCMFSIGFIHFFWDYKECAKCEEGH